MTSYIAARNSPRADLARLGRADQRARLAGARVADVHSRRHHVKLADLLKGVIIQSGNDSSIAVAEFIAGSEDAFADMMNQQAAALSMTGTMYHNATGLPAEGHHTTRVTLPS